MAAERLSTPFSSAKKEVTRYGNLLVASKHRRKYYTNGGDSSKIGKKALFFTQKSIILDVKQQLPEICFIFLIITSFVEHFFNVLLSSINILFASLYY